MIAVVTMAGCARVEIADAKTKRTSSKESRRTDFEAAHRKWEIEREKRLAEIKRRSQAIEADRKKDQATLWRKHAEEERALKDANARRRAQIEATFKEWSPDKYAAIAKANDELVAARTALEAAQKSRNAAHMQRVENKSREREEEQRKIHETDIRWRALAGVLAYADKPGWDDLKEGAFRLALDPYGAHAAVPPLRRIAHREPNSPLAQLLYGLALWSTDDHKSHPETACDGIRTLKKVFELLGAVNTHFLEVPLRLPVFGHEAPESRRLDDFLFRSKFRWNGLKWSSLSDPSFAGLPVRWDSHPFALLACIVLQEDRLANARVNLAVSRRFIALLSSIRWLWEIHDSAWKSVPPTRSNLALANNMLGTLAARRRTRANKAWKEGNVIGAYALAREANEAAPGPANVILFADLALAFDRAAEAKTAATATLAPDWKPLLRAWTWTTWGLARRTTLIAEADLELGKPADALAALEPLARSTSETAADNDHWLSAWVQVLRARALLRLRRADDATTAALAAQKIAPGETDVLAWGAAVSGIAHLDRGEIDEAIALLSRAIDQEARTTPRLAQRHTAGFYNTLGIAYLRRGLTDLAIDKLTQGLAALPDDATLRFNLARAYQMKGQRDRAIDNFYRALGGAAGDEVTKHFLAQVSSAGATTVAKAHGTESVGPKTPSTPPVTAKKAAKKRATVKKARKPYRVAVFQFSTAGSAIRREGTAEIVNAVFTGALARLGHRVVERQALEAILAEQARSRAAEFDPATAISLGRLKAAEVAFFGTIAEDSTGFEIDVRAVSAHDGTVALARSKRVPRTRSLRAALNALADEFAALKL
ncbi:MAG: hypothetical protein HYY84_08565 [Deltaproteobacteria bacterium]|nr:hypothetical protein [Deltaproteobacteria bacterium]